MFRHAAQRVYPFLEKAAKHGDVHVALGSDCTLIGLKGRAPVTTELERKYMFEAVRHVKRCTISLGSGILDFVDELKRVKPDIFIVNEERLVDTRVWN